MENTPKSELFFNPALKHIEDPFPSTPHPMKKALQAAQETEWSARTTLKPQNPPSSIKRTFSELFPESDETLSLRTTYKRRQSPKRSFNVNKTKKGRSGKRPDPIDLPKEDTVGGQATSPLPSPKHAKGLFLEAKDLLWEATYEMSNWMYQLARTERMRAFRYYNIPSNIENGPDIALEYPSLAEQWTPTSIYKLIFPEYYLVVILLFVIEKGIRWILDWIALPFIQVIFESVDFLISWTIYILGLGLIPAWAFTKRYWKVFSPPVLVLIIWLVYLYVDENSTFLYCDPCSDTTVGAVSWIPLSGISGVSGLLYCPRTDALYSPAWASQLWGLPKVPSFRAVAHINTEVFNQYEILTTNISTPLVNYDSLQLLVKQSDSGARTLRTIQNKKKPLYSVKNLELKLLKFQHFLLRFLEFRRDALGETLNGMGALSEVVEYAQSFHNKSWNAMAIPHQWVLKLYQERLNSSFETTKHFLEKAEEGKVIVGQLQQYLHLNNQLRPFKRGDLRTEEVYARLFEQITHANKIEIVGFTKAIQKWAYHEAFEQELFYFQFQIEAILRVLSGSLEKQERFQEKEEDGRQEIKVQKENKDAGEGLRCTTDLREQIQKLRWGETNAREQFDNMDQVIENLGELNNPLEEEEEEEFYLYPAWA